MIFLNQGRSVDWRGIPAAICGAAARHKHSERKFMPSQNIFLQCPTLPSLPKSKYFLTVPPRVTDGCVTVGCVTVGRPAQTVRFELPPPPRVTDGCVTVGCVTVGRPAQTLRFELPPPPRVTADRLKLYVLSCPQTSVSQSGATSGQLKRLRRNEKTHAGQALLPKRPR